MGARVFISCGQREDTGEKQLANEIAARLEALHYEPYIAVEEQTLLGLRENIFRRLVETEYFLFVDFRREELIGADGPPHRHRGSLFCQQELAIASFLEVPAMLWQEDGVIPLDGVLQPIQANPIPFSDRRLLPEAIAKRVKSQWRCDWRNELSLQLPMAGEGFASPATVGLEKPDGPRATWFHVRVRNRHRSKPALNCYAYIQYIRDLTREQDVPVEPIEVSWRAYDPPNATIAPEAYRDIDAFCVRHDAPADPLFHLHTRSSRFAPRLPGPGTYELAYRVTSENFPETRGAFRLHLGESLEDHYLELASD